MRSLALEIDDDLLYGCADGVVRPGFEVGEKALRNGATPVECLGRILYGWREGGDVAFVTTDGAHVRDGRVVDRDTAAVLAFEDALSRPRLEAALDRAPTERRRAFAALAADADRIARLTSAVVGMTVRRRFHCRHRESVPLGEDRRYEIGVGRETRASVEHVLRRVDVAPAAATFVADCLPESVTARVRLRSTASAASAAANGSGRTASERGTGRSGADDGDNGDDRKADAFRVEPPPDLTFDDVGGMADLRGRLRERVIEPFRDPDLFDRYGLGAVNGILLYGPPGTGKTYVTRALAGELGCRFVNLSPADVVSKWVGEAAQQVRDAFEIARERQPCLVFVDEIDALAPERGGTVRSTQSERQMLNQLLVELAEIQGEAVVVVAATNRYDQVDGAVRRSGRFDERIEVPPPDGPSRVEILFTHLRGRPFDPDAIDPDRVIERTEGFVASDVELVATNAARSALRAERATGVPQTIDQSHVDAAIEETESSLDPEDRS